MLDAGTCAVLHLAAWTWHSHAPLPVLRRLGAGRPGPAHQRQKERKTPPPAEQGDRAVYDAKGLFYADVQRGNAAGQITVFDFGEADGTHQLCELTLGRNLG